MHDSCTANLKKFSPSPLKVAKHLFIYIMMINLFSLIYKIFQIKLPLPNLFLNLTLVDKIASKPLLPITRQPRSC